MLSHQTALKNLPQKTELTQTASKLAFCDSVYKAINISKSQTWYLQKLTVVNC